MSLDTEDSTPAKKSTAEFSTPLCSLKSRCRPLGSVPSFPEPGPSDRASGATAQELKSMNLNLASGSEESDREPPGAVANSPDGLRNESQPIVSRTDDQLENYESQICAANMLLSEVRLLMNSTDAEETCLERRAGIRTRSRVEKYERNTSTPHRRPAGQQVGQFLCDWKGCKFSADRVSVLKRHKSVMHKYACGWEGCSYSCKNLDRLNAHRGKHTGEQEKPYPCPVDGCNFSTTCADRVHSHLKRHRPESTKVHRCGQEGCSYAAIRRPDLVRHLRRHTGEKQLQCDKCSYKTGSADCLKTHTRIHTGEKFACPLSECGYSTIYKNCFKTHVKKRHDLDKIPSTESNQNKPETSEQETCWPREQFRCFWKGCLFMSDKTAELVEHRLSHTEISLHANTSRFPSVPEAPETDPFDLTHLTHSSELGENDGEYAEVDLADSSTAPESCLDAKIESTEDGLGILTLIMCAEMPAPESEARQKIQKVDGVHEQQPDDTNTTIEIVVPTNCPRKRKQRTPAHDQPCLDDCRGQKRKTTCVRSQVEALLADSDSKPDDDMRDLAVAIDEPGPSKLGLGSGSSADDDDDSDYQPTKTSKRRRRSSYLETNAANGEHGPTVSISNRRRDPRAMTNVYLCPIDACDYEARKGRSRVKEHLIRCHSQADILSGLAVLYTEKEVAVLSLEKDQRLKCTIKGCGYSSSKQLLLSRHLETKHSKDAVPVKEFICDWNGCSFKSLYTKSLIEHRLAKHTGEKPFACGLPGCSYTAVGISAITKHKRTVHSDSDLKLYNCGYCEKTFRQSSNCLEHERAVHSELTGKGITKKQCPIAGCSYASHRTYRMNQHMHSHSDERQFACDFEGCPYRAKLIHNLKVHKKSHAEAVELVKVRCDWKGCNYQTNHPRNMVTHKITHTGELYHCQWEGCDYRSAHQGNVKQHMVKHTGKKALQCKNCGKGYTTQKSFKLHTKQCHTVDSSDNNIAMADNEDAFDNLMDEDEAAVGVILSI